MSSPPPVVGSLLDLVQPLPQPLSRCLLAEPEANALLLDSGHVDVRDRPVSAVRLPADRTEPGRRSSGLRELAAAVAAPEVDEAAEATEQSFGLGLER